MPKNRCSRNEAHRPHRWVEEIGYAGHGGYREEHDCNGETRALDPEPWICTHPEHGNSPVRLDREPTGMHADQHKGFFRFNPSYGYEQRREFYEKGDV